MTRMEGADAAQVAQVLGGDRDAFRVLVERHSRSVFRLAYRMTGNQADAEEVVQEAFLRAYRRLDKFEERANFGTWVYRIGVNCALDLMRKRKTEMEQRVTQRTDDEERPDLMESAASSDPTPERIALSGELKEHVEAAMRLLSPVERTAFVLRHHEGRSIEEIGAVLKLSAGATKNSVFRAVQKLRKELEPFTTTKMSARPAR
ncbi:MAG TPA: sigma-70 family RNA polymerase sigma factor [Candidatus Acidoferrales bacterium]|nr:sigma-70 family RNA polymerase sigma factor [Candidatus Acidoferrales bacterium]